MGAAVVAAVAGWHVINNLLPLRIIIEVKKRSK